MLNQQVFVENFGLENIEAMHQIMLHVITGYMMWHL